MPNTTKRTGPQYWKNRILEVFAAYNRIDPESMNVPEEPSQFRNDFMKAVVNGNITKKSIQAIREGLAEGQARERHDTDSGAYNAAGYWGCFRDILDSTENALQR